MYLFFDTETTGLPKNWKAPVTDLNNWPRLVQLAFLLFDNNGNLAGFPLNGFKLYHYPRAPRVDSFLRGS
jgi:hypothetical protein